ncbi:MAG: HAMP domain-containing histidine kinase [Planctomycetes bacterium]|nr:HAMP domain-containing histidine kinase [Planctomycetota bacterium]
MSATSNKSTFELPLTGEATETTSGLEHAQSLSLPLLYENIRWFCRLRWWVMGGLVFYGGLGFFGSWLARSGLQRPGLWPWIIAVILLLANLAHIRHALVRTMSRARLNLWSQIVLDLLILTAVVHFVGSCSTHIAFAYLFHIVLACVFLPRRQSLIVALLAAGLYVVCIILEASGILSEASIWADTDATVLPITTASLVAQVGSAIGIWGILWYLVSHLSAMVRARDAELADTNHRLKAALQERARHMLHTTHALKSPFAAIYSNAQLLLEGAYGALPTDAQEVIQRIGKRCRGLSREIQEMLQLANLQSIGQETSVLPETIQLTELLDLTIDRASTIALERKVILETKQRPAVTWAISDHVSMLLENILSNAVFYSRPGMTVWVTCGLDPKGTPVVTIRDEGIGIDPQKLPHIFDDYYRAKEAALHYSDSSGLGLAIVRHVASLNHIRVQVESQPGIGTQFTLYFPLHKPAHQSEPA